MSTTDAPPTSTAAQLLAAARRLRWLLNTLEDKVAYENGTGYSGPQTLALLAINELPEPVLLSHLAACLGQQAQSVTSLVDRLEHAGLAKRRRHATDRRAICVELTPKGRSIVDSMIAHHLNAAWASMVQLHPFAEE